MEKKKTKLTLSGNLKKSISNIEKAKTQGKNSVFIEKKSNKFATKKSFNNNAKFSFKPKNPNFSKPKFSKEGSKPYFFKTLIFKTRFQTLFF